MNNKVSSVLNSIEKIDNLIMEADVSVSDAMSDVYSKQFKMEGNVTEDYINHEYYQESVIAGILIGGGIIAVLATAIVLITKHVKKSASGDPEKKNDTSTAAGVSLDKPEEFNKKVEQLKSELEKAGGKLTISDVGFDASKLKQKYEMIKELCGYAENFLKGTEDDEINGALNEFNKKLEEINGIDYKLSGEVDVTSASLDEIKSLAGPIQQMTANLEKVSKEFEKRSKENKNANTGEMDDAKKERFEKLKEGLNQINKGSTDLGKSVDNEFSIIRKYFEAVSKAAKEKDKPAQAESEKKSESEKSQETPQNPDILKQKIYPITAKWASTPSNSDSKHPGAKLTADEAYNIISSIHTYAMNHRGPIALNTLKAKANEDPTKAMLIKNLIEATINNKEVFDTEDEETINEIKSGLPELETIAAKAPSEEPKKDESENSQEIKLSQEDTKNIAEFANTFVLQGKNKKGTTTMPVDDIKKTLSEILPYIKSHQYTNATIKMRELFNEQDNIDLKSIFMDLMIEAKNPLFKGEIPEDKTISDMKKSISIKTNKTSDTQTDEEPKTDEPKTGTKEKKNNVITIAKNDNALYDLINGWKSLSAFESVFGNPSLAEKRIDRAYREESALSAKNSPTQLSKVQTIEMISTNETYTNFMSNLDDTLKNINEHPDLLEKISDTSRKNLVDAFTYFFNRNKEAIDQHNDGMWPSILSRYEEMYNTYKGGNDTQTDEENEDDVPNDNDNDDAVNEDSVNNDYIIDDSGIWYLCGSMFPDEYTLKDTINHVDDFSKNINDIENRKTQTDKITDKTEIEKELNRLIQALNIIEKGISFDNITNVAPMFVRVLKIIKEYTENSISISDSNPLHSKATDIKDKVDKLISDYSALKPNNLTDQNDSENTETTDTADESTPETSQNTDESSNQNGSENSDETKKQPEPKIEYPTISGFNGLSDLVSELVSSGSIKRIVKNKKSGVDIDKLIAKAYNAEKTLQNKGTLTGDNAVQVLSNSNDEEEVLEKINTALTNITSDIKHFNNLTSQSKTKLVAAFEIFLNRNKFSGNQNIIDLKRNISKSLSFIKAKSNVNTGSAITAAQDTTTPQNDIDSNQQDQNSPQTQQQSQPESSPQPEPKADDTSTKSIPTFSELIGNDDVDKIIETYNQTASSNNKISSVDISRFKKFQDQIKANNLEDVFNEFIKINYIDLNEQISAFVFTKVLFAAADTVGCYEHESDLNSFLLDQYSRYQKFSSLNQLIFAEVKRYAEMKGINVILTTPNGEQVEVGTNSSDNSTNANADNTQPKNINQDGNNTPPTQTEMAKLKNHTLVHDVVTEANQRNEDGVPMITNDMETELKNASEEHLMDFIGHFITELTGNHTMIETIPFTRRNIITLAAYAKQANKLLKSQNNLRDFLTQQYEYYKDPAQQEYIYKMAKLFAQDYNISVVLTDPSGKKEYINPTTTFN